MIVKRNQAFALPVILTDDTDFKTPKTGVDVSSVVCKYAKEGDFILTTKTLHKLLYWSTFQSLVATQTPKTGPSTTVSGSFVFEPGKFDNGARLTAMGGAIEFPTVSPTFDFAQGCIEIWIKPDGWSLTNGVPSSTPDGTRYLGEWYESGTGNFMKWFFSSSATHWVLQYAGGTDISWSGSITGLTVGDGELAHIAFVWDRTHGTKKRRIYLNNVELDSENTVWADEDMTGADFYLQADHDKGQWFDGLQDNFKWWDFPKTDFSDRNIEDSMPDAWIELGEGIYLIVFTAAELDTLKKFIYNVAVASALPYPGSAYIQNHLNDDIGVQTDLIPAEPAAVADIDSVASLIKYLEGKGGYNIAVVPVPARKVLAGMLDSIDMYISATQKLHIELTYSDDKKVIYKDYTVV